MSVLNQVKHYEEMLKCTDWYLNDILKYYFIQITIANRPGVKKRDELQVSAPCGTWE